MGIKDFKKAAFVGASRVAMNPSVLRILSNPKVQKTFLSMLNANSDVQEWFAEQMKSRARTLSLVTRDELMKVQRELRYQVAEMEIMADRVIELNQKISKLEKLVAGSNKSSAKKPAPRKTASARKTTRAKSAVRPRAKGKSKA